MLWEILIVVILLVILAFVVFYTQSWRFVKTVKKKMTQFNLGTETPKPAKSTGDSWWAKLHKDPKKKSEVDWSQLLRRGGLDSNCII